MIFQEDWLWDPFYIWEGNFPNQPMPVKYYWLNILHAGWYSFGLFAHVFIDERRKDYWEMFTHHLVSLILLYFTLVEGYYRFMALTAFTHDICDIFLHICKMGKYVDNVWPTPNWVQVPAFLPVPLSWLIFRLALFPRSVMYTCIVQCPLMIGIDSCSFYFIYTPLLFVLWSLQWYWFYLIMRIAYRKAIKKKSFADIREGEDRTVRYAKKKTNQNNKTKKE